MDSDIDDLVTQAGFPHSDTPGSKLACQLPEAFRRLPRPSSPVVAKASTVCAWSLDHITPNDPFFRRILFRCNPPMESSNGIFESNPRNIRGHSYECNIPLQTRLERRLVHMTTLRIVKKRDDFTLIKRGNPNRSPDASNVRGSLNPLAHSKSTALDDFECSSIKEEWGMQETERRSWNLVEPAGIEPATLCLQSRCSPV